MTKSKDPTQTPATPAKAAPAAQVSPRDTIAVNRVLPVTPTKDIPRPPPRFKATDAETRRRELRKVAVNLTAELLRALREAQSKVPQLQGDFGHHAPEAADAGAIADRHDSISPSLSAAETLATFLRELEDINLSDGEFLLETLWDLYQHNIKYDGSLVGQYPALVAYFEGKSAAIASGKAHAKAVETAAEGAAAAAGDEEPPSDKPPKK